VEIESFIDSHKTERHKFVGNAICSLKKKTPSLPINSAATLSCKRVSPQPCVRLSFGLARMMVILPPQLYSRCCLRERLETRVLFETSRCGITHIKNTSESLSVRTFHLFKIPVGVEEYTCMPAQLQLHSNALRSSVNKMSINERRSLYTYSPCAAALT
jgi:hypothetical protein